jgi:hypothetical protein
MKSAKENSNPKKNSKITKPAENKKILENKITRTHEEIRQKANEIYLQRIERGEYGTADLDWINAEKHLNDPEG